MNLETTYPLSKTEKPNSSEVKAPLKKEANVIYKIGSTYDFSFPVLNSQRRNEKRTLF